LVEVAVPVISGPVQVSTLSVATAVMGHREDELVRMQESVDVVIEFPK